MSIALERVAPDDWSGVQRLVERLSRLVIDTGNISLGLRVGTGSVSFPGGTAISNVTTVTHGLGRTPIFFGAFETQDHAGADMMVLNTFTYTSTSVQTRGCFVLSSAPAAGNIQYFTWVAIG